MTKLDSMIRGDALAAKQAAPLVLDPGATFAAENAAPVVVEWATIETEGRRVAVEKWRRLTEEATAKAAEAIKLAENMRQMFAAFARELAKFEKVCAGATLAATVASEQADIARQKMEAYREADEAAEVAGALPDAALARKYSIIRKCATCGEEFAFLPSPKGGRPPIRCEKHRIKPEVKS